MYRFVQRQYRAIRQGGWPAFWPKAKYALSFFLLLLGIPVVLGMRLLRPWVLIRINPLPSSRLGHFAANTELYLCEREADINVPARRHLDICYFAGPVSNHQLGVMWRRLLRVWPAWILDPAYTVNKWFPGGAAHEVGTNTQHDRDVHSLLERIPAHLSFTPDEERRGKALLRSMGIPDGSEFICLAARDNAYLKAVAAPGAYDYHDYRNVDIQNFVLAAEALAERGYFVLRMGATVNAPLRSTHPRVIDYAANGMRSDFMDIYLGARCRFCLSVGTGFDAVPMIFRRPIAYASMVPIGYAATFLKDAVFICKKHWVASEDRWLSLKEVFDVGVGFGLQATDYEVRGVNVIENTPEEIMALTIEMLERLIGTWRSAPGDDALQQRFWEIYPVDARDRDKKPLHGAVRARYGAQYLRENPKWLT